MHSQCNTLLEAFKRGEVLSANYAYQKYGIATFSQRLGELQRRGYNIVGHWQESPAGKRFKRYVLVAEK